MSDEATTPAIEAYCKVMEEIKGRYAALRAACAGQLAMPQPCALEFCYLQLRLLCELVALGCLVAHRDIIEVAESRKITKAWQPNVILSELAKLHPQFYPQPSRQILGANGQVESLELIQDGFLTKQEPLKLHGECGDVLHRGSIKSLLSQEPSRYNFGMVSQACQKIVTLLNHHQIQTIDSDVQYWVSMHGAGDGRIHWARMVALDSAPERA